eukprot:TRINITY_DN7_c0_g2_i1.p4 TRINITY_DN7_c0_g2~~TRINITY_DN7_c0_g2_i1.p4  ORF type:complete len:394 (+),score=58.07 TRINITY_DN7_c0_g2_i1:7489-8670(+)
MRNMPVKCRQNRRLHSKKLIKHEKQRIRNGLISTKWSIKTFVIEPKTFLILDILKGQKIIATSQMWRSSKERKGFKNYIQLKNLATMQRLFCQQQCTQKMIKVAGDPKLFDDQKEVGELMEMVDKTKDQINATSERISKHRQAIMHEKEQLENAKEKWNNLVKSGKVMGITPEMLIKQKPNKEKIEEKARCEKALEQLKQQKESLENRFHVRGRDLYKQSKEIQQKIEIAKAEIEQLEKKITFEQNVLEYLAEELNNGREKISRKITREVYKENVVENTPEVLMQELSMKENTASLKIQKAWKRYVNNKKRIKKKSKAEIVPLASRIEPLEVPPQRPAYEQRDCILLFDKKSRKFKKKKKYNPIETFGQSQEAPLMIEQGIQARDENYYQLMK